MCVYVCVCLYESVYMSVKQRDSENKWKSE